ncbi:glycosyltransferase [Citrifermentans bremense]|uniref:glycosyltransferase n=1 Tax=Citrifermentans bremense TaxID=60035 RepID=UPI000406A9C5|nr:glycosyltransferase [Citrifermentans bremense]
MKGSGKKYLVSAIVSTYKAERFLRGKLEDLEAQTMAEELEIVVIDSGSPQNERAIVEEFQKRYDNIRYLRTKERETVYQAWNRGIRMATGEFVTNANTDDRLRDDAYEVLVRTLREHPECVLAYPDMRITQKENGSFANHTPYGFKSWPPYDRTSLLELCCVGPFPLWRRSLHDEIGYFDERYQCIADYEFWLRASERHQFIHVSQFLGLYWLNEQTVSRNGDLPTLEYLYIQKLYRQKFAHLIVKPQPHPPFVEEAFARLIRQEPPPSLAQLEDFTTAHPEFAPGHHQLAQLCFKVGDIGRARKHFEKAVLLAPDSREFTESLEGFLKLELYQSLQHHKGLVCAEPEEAETQLSTGMILMLLERFEPAREHYRRALALAPASAVARENLAFLEKMSEGAAAQPSGYHRFSRPEVQRAVSRRARHVLDVGCAAGCLGQAIKRRQGAEVWGVEPAAEAAAAARKVLDRVIQAPVEGALSALPDRHFDGVLLADVLEHLAEPEQVLRRLLSKLSGSGEVVATLPNVRHWSVVQGLLDGSWEYADAGILDRTHLRFFTRKSAVALFEAAGYAAESVEPIALSGDEGMPKALLKALADGGVLESTLAEESAAYQYLFRLVPKASRLTSIVILTWNELSCTRECLESIQRYTPEPHEVILVDNGSSDGTIPFLREFCAGKVNYRLIENGKNLGFAAGCNIGMRAARGGRILLLNNDTVLTRGWLSGMIEALQRDPKAGIVGPMTNEIAGPQKLAKVPYRGMEELQAFAERFRSDHYGRRIEVDRVVGFCMLFTRELLETVGELDERFGSGNFEDDDFCLRAALAGYRCLIAGDVFIHHYGSRSFAGNRVDYAAAMWKNRKAFDAKWDLAALEQETAARVVTHNAMLRGARLARRGKLNDAVELMLQEGIRFSPASPAPYLALAWILCEAGNWREALEVLEQVPAGCELDAALIRGRAFKESGEPAQAVEAARQAEGIDPEAPGTLHLNGVLALSQGEAKKGEELLRRAIALDPGFALPYGALAQTAWERGEREQGVRLAELAFVLAPLELSALARYHEFATACGQLPREEELLREALEIHRDHKGLSYGLIELLIRSGRYGEAMTEIERGAARFGLDDGSIDAALQIRKLAGPPLPCASGKGSVSLCMIVKDEARHLPAVLDSVRGLADELIVVDTGSSDRSCDIARIFGARLFSFPWNGSFADARNFSLSQALGEWILVLDADEVIAAEDVAPLKELAQRTARPTAFSFTTRNYTHEVTRRNWNANAGEYPAEEEGRGWTPSDKVRLFPNDPALRFEGAVHELVEPSLLHLGLPIHACDVPVHHYGKLDAERCAKKQEAYYLLGLKKLEEDGGSVEALIELARQATELNRGEEAQRLWHRLLQVHPENAEAYLNLGYLQLSAGEYPKARESALKGAQLAPGMKEAAFNLAKCELFLGDTEKARESCREMLEKWPDYPPALSLSCVCLLLQGEKAQAEKLLQRLAAMRFDCADFLEEYAAGLQKGEHADLALPLMELARDISGGAAP